MFRKMMEVIPVLCLLAVVGVAAYGQNVNAVVNGTITDPQGAVVPGASVTFQNVATGTKQNGVTSSSGLYRVGDLIPGTYLMTVSAPGFKTVKKPGIDLHVQDQLQLNLQLTLGSVSQAITVAAGAPELQLQSQTLGQVIESQQVQKMPLNGLNVMNLMSLTAGVVAQGTTTGTAVANQGGSFTNPAGWDNYQIGGATAGWNAVYLDGEPMNVTLENWLSLVPTQAAIDEFKVDSNAVSAQFGRFAGGVVSYSTKSGGNQFHGTAYDYLRNTVLTANTFFGDRSTLPKSVLIQNQYGTTIGGPILRNKDFFFFSWEGLRRVSKTAQATLEPTTANLEGNFSTSTTPIINPTTGQQYECNGTPNVICPNLIDPTATAALNAGYWTPPNTSGAGYNLFSTAAYDSGTDQYIARLDDQISDKQRLFGRYTYWTLQEYGLPAVSRFLVPNTVNSRTHQVDLGDSYVFSPSLVGDVRLYYDRFNYTVSPSGLGHPNLSTLGANYATIPEPFKAYPIFNVVGYTTQTNILQIMGNDIYGLSLSAVKTIDKHTITFGGEIRLYQWYVVNNDYPGGELTFTGNATGNALADFVVGMITPGVTTLSNTGAAGNTSSLLQASKNATALTNYQGYFVTDTYHPMAKLNITAGLRWELPGAWAERHNSDTVLEPNAASPLGTIANPATGENQQLTGILAVVGSSMYSSRDESPQNLHLFDPRVGFNYAFTSNMVLRAGFGISQPSIDSGTEGPQTSPVNQAQTPPIGPLSNPYPDGILLPIGHNLNLNEPYTEFLQTLEGAAITSRIPSTKFPTVYQYNLSLQRTLGSNGTIELAYAGSHGTHLAMPNAEIDQLADKYDICGTDSTQPQCNGHLLTAPVTNNPLTGLLTPTTSIATPGGLDDIMGQFLRPYPQYLAVTATYPWIGNSSYNAMQINVRKQFHSESSILINYTWSKLMDNGDSQLGYLEGKTTGTVQDFTTMSGERTESDFDARQYLNAAYILNVPFGHNQPFLNHLGPAMDRLASGWALSGITTLRTGYPVSLIYSTGTKLQQLFGAGQARPNFTSGCTKTIGGAAASKLAKWFNTGCFSAPSQYGFGDEPRVDSGILTQGIANTDFTAEKTTAITERVSLDFRADIFNLFNRVQFSAPSTSLGSSAFGTVTSQLNNPRQAQMSMTLNF